MKFLSRIILYSLLAITPMYISSCGGAKKAAPQEEEAAPVDTDKDGLTDEEEAKLGTDPNNPDTDGDGLKDGDEVKVYGTDPLKADTDGDGLTDGEEVLSHGTDPKKPDTDGDGLTDGDEIKVYRTNPKKADTDGDGLNDGVEVNVHKTSPINPDTDGDGFSDGQEIEMGTNPLDPNDPIFIAELETVNFDFDRASLDNDGARSLARNVQKLQSNPKFTVQVNAYTDHIGGDQYNLRLSTRRANVVLDFYRKNGIDESRITAQGLGKTPFASCMQDDANGRGCRKDRRAESLPVSPYKFRPSKK